MTSREQAQTIKVVVAENIDRAIQRTGRTNRSVAEEIGVTEHQVWRWRRGRTVPSHRYLIALADVLFGGDFASMYAEPDRRAA